MDVGAIDRSATAGGGPLRDAGSATKLLALALMLASVLVTWNLLVLSTALLCLTAALTWGGIDLKLAFKLAVYPAMFAAVFAFASAPDVLTGTIIVLKAVSAALSAVTVVLSTPYPQVFAPIQRLTPGVVGDSLLMTYRATFIMLAKFGSLLRAARLRAGLRTGHPFRAAKATASALGGLLLYSVDLAQRDYDIMRLRGYAGRLRATPLRSRDRRADATLIAGASLLLATSMIWRFASQSLNPYSWMAPLPAVLLLAAASIRRHTR